MSAEGGIGNVVAEHYNKLDEKGISQRKESRIYFMRNFNNWIKSLLINEYVSKIRSKKEEKLQPGEPRPTINVLDMGCGKGGDLQKWHRSRVNHVTCVDIAGTSVAQAEQRYRDMTQRNRNQRPFDAEFITADCTKDNLRSKYHNPELQFDLVSCQFAFHYCFESLPQAECMIRNAAECLKPGGFFIGTTPDALEIVRRVRNGGGGAAAANKVYSIAFDDPAAVQRPPIFGAKYSFHLEGVVDCPEFLVYFPALEKVAEKFGFTLVGKRRFGNYFTDNKDKNLQLLQRMSALEPYPGRLLGDEGEGDYTAAQEHFRANPDQRGQKVGTITKDEWEAITLYTIFAFKKLNL